MLPLWLHCRIAVLELRKLEPWSVYLREPVGLKPLSLYVKLFDSNALSVALMVPGGLFWPLLESRPTVGM